MRIEKAKSKEIFDSIIEIITSSRYTYKCIIDTDGEIIIFDIPNESVKYENSDTVSILAALGFCDINLKKY